MKVGKFHLPLALAALSIVAIDAAAQTPSAPTEACVALTMPSVQGVEDATAFSTAVRDLFASYLKGPTIRTISLESRLPSQAVVEARGQKCGYVLLVTLERKRGGGSSTGRILGQAAGVAVSRAPVYGAAGAAASSATWAGEKQSIATRLRSGRRTSSCCRIGSARPMRWNGRSRSSSKPRPNQTVKIFLTPLVEKAANGIVATISGRSSDPSSTMEHPPRRTPAADGPAQEAIGNVSEAMLSLVYGELRRLAASYLRRKRPGPLARLRHQALVRGLVT